MVSIDSLPLPLFLEGSGGSSQKLRNNCFKFIYFSGLRHHQQDSVHVILYMTILWWRIDDARFKWRVDDFFAILSESKHRRVEVATTTLGKK